MSNNSRKSLRQMIFLFFILTLIGSIGHTAASDQKEASAKLGDITSFRGDIVIRSKGQWKRISKLPVEIFSTDKIVTNRGRAEFVTQDKSVVRLDLDSNVTMYKGKGNQIALTVSLGNISFDMSQKISSSSGLLIKSPTMSTELESGAGQLLVGTDGNTKFGMNEGSLKGNTLDNVYKNTKGSFGKIDSPVVLSQHDVAFGRMPLSNPEIRKSILQKTANRALNFREKISRLEKSAKIDLVIARALNQNIKELKSESMQKKAALALAKASAIESSISNLELQAYIASFSEIMAEATANKINLSNALFGSQMKEAGAFLIAVKNKFSIYKEQSLEIFNKMPGTQTSIQTRSLAAVSMTIENAIHAYISATESMHSLVIAVMFGDKDLINIAEKAFLRTQELAKKNDDFVYATANLVKQVIDSLSKGRESYAEANAMAARSIANASFTFASFAASTSAISINALAADQLSLNNALTAAANFGKLASAMNLTAANVMQNASIGNIDQVQKGFDFSESGKEVTSSKDFGSMGTLSPSSFLSEGTQSLPDLGFPAITTKDFSPPTSTTTTGETTNLTTEISPFSMSEPTSQTTTFGTGIVIPIIEPLDLPTASPSK